jgi:hypothetical protein
MDGRRDGLRIRHLSSPPVVLAAAVWIAVVCAASSSRDEHAIGSIGGLHDEP